MLQKSLVLFLLSISTWTFAQAQSALKDYQLIIFEGSDWCSNCIRLDKNILSKAEFEDFVLSKQISIERVDFPQRKSLNNALIEKNAKIAEAYNFNGIFPTVLLIKTKDDSVIKLNYSNQNAEEFIELIKSNIVLE